MIPTSWPDFEIEGSGRLGGRKRKTKKTKGREADDDDSVKIPKWQPMDYIEISPYENISNAEIDMKLFEDLHDLLEEPLQSKAAEMFGSKNARSLVKAHGKCSIIVVLQQI